MKRRRRRRGSGCGDAVKRNTDTQMLSDAGYKGAGNGISRREKFLRAGGWGVATSGNVPVRSPYHRIGPSHTTGDEVSVKGTTPDEYRRDRNGEKRISLIAAFMLPVIDHFILKEEVNMVIIAFFVVSGLMIALALAALGFQLYYIFT
jgi:hypothetical protein